MQPMMPEVEKSRPRTRNWVFSCLATILSTLIPSARADTASLEAGSRCGYWPRWETFKRDFISTDGRVIDVGSPDARTVSEGQAYGLFFALVANDRMAFDNLLRWTEHNLAQDDLTMRLPAWLWGQGAGGEWAVLDANPAADADLWMAYTLLEAGQLWQERSYSARGTLLARRILDEETAMIPGLGLTLLPGPVGFHPAPDVWRLNPSYSPLQIMRGLGTRLADNRWSRLTESSARVLFDAAPQGFAPDWILYRAPSHLWVGGFEADTEHRGEGSYDAIRVYLWAGMLPSQDPFAKVLLGRFKPFAAHLAVHGAPPESVDTITTAANGLGYAGFSAAAIPFLRARGDAALAEQQRARIDTLEQQSASGYYGQVLTLFGLGWDDGRYRFAVDGTLHVQWEEQCTGAAR